MAPTQKAAGNGDGTQKSWRTLAWEAQRTKTLALLYLQKPASVCCQTLSSSSPAGAVSLRSEVLSRIIMAPRRGQRRNTWSRLPAHRIGVSL
ncbi:unnamed protein product [Arctogadus glacialis]